MYRKVHKTIKEKKHIIRSQYFYKNTLLFFDIENHRVNKTQKKTVSMIHYLLQIFYSFSIMLDRVVGPYIHTILNLPGQTPKILAWNTLWLQCAVENCRKITVDFFRTNCVCARKMRKFVWLLSINSIKENFEIIFKINGT